MRGTGLAGAAGMLPLRSMTVITSASLVACALFACGGSIGTGTTEDAPATCSPNPSGGACLTPDTPDATTTTVTGRTPKKHRAAAQTCDATRANGEPSNIPDSGPGEGYIQCRSNAECTAGINGRCNGNSHDGWRCTYDACFADTDCAGTGVCECEGAFRADANVCLGEGNCRVDADCGGGFCSPSLGSCGHYTKTSGYFCHTAKDECIDDEDCGGQGEFGQKPYCAYDKNAGAWKCSTSECAG